MEIIQDDIKQELRKKECLMCGKTRTYYSSKLKGSFAYITLILWRPLSCVLNALQALGKLRGRRLRQSYA